MRSRFTTSVVPKLLLALALVGCGSSLTLSVPPTTASDPELVPSPQLSETVYKKVLLLPPEGRVSLENVESKAATEKDVTFYTSTLEKVLLGKGFEIISSEVTARVGGQAAKGKNAAEKAMILGKKTKADAVLLLQSVSVKGVSRFFDIQDKEATEVEAGFVKYDDEQPIHKETGNCLFRFPSYELKIEAKLIDTRTGSILWVGSGRQSTTDVAKESWVGQLDGSCRLTDENYLQASYLDNEDTLSRAATTLFERIVAPMKEQAFAGAVVQEKPKVAPAPAAPPPPAPKLKTAVVSSKRGTVREGPNGKSKKLMAVSRKAKVTVLETMGEWIKVKVQDGTTGWMHESTIIIDD